MRKTGMTIENVKEVYSGPEGELWELIMGEQIHVGGWKHSSILADAAGITEGQKVLDICSALGAGLRFLEKKYGIKGYGLDATPHMIDEAIIRTASDGQSDKITYKVGNAENIPWDDNEFDVVWGEDAWCYVGDKEKLIQEASRVLKPGGTIAFTDWIEGPQGMDEETAQRICSFMKFPDVLNREKYVELLEKHGFKVKLSEDLTEEYAGYVEFYIKMLTEQLYFDALKIIGFNSELMQAMGAEMVFMQELAHAGKIAQGLFVARKKGE